MQSHCGDSLVYPIHDLTVVPFVFAVQGCPEVAGWEGVFWHVQEWPGRWVRKLCKVADEFKSGHKLSTVGSCFSSKRWTSAVWALGCFGSLQKMSQGRICESADPAVSPGHRRHREMLFSVLSQK